MQTKKSWHQVSPFIGTLLLWITCIFQATASSNIRLVTRRDPLLPDVAPDSGSSFSPAFSADGKHLVFASSSINFVESAKSGNRIDLFDYLGPGEPLGLLTPPNSEGYATLGESFPVGVASDRVVFLSTSPDLYPGATNLVQRLYSQSLYSVYRRLLARDIRGPAYDSLDIQVATLADNGQYVFYETAAVVLNGVTNISRPQIYRMSLDTLGSPELASFGPDGFSSDDRILTGMTVNKDGTMLAYVAQTATNGPVVVVNDLNARTSLSFSVGSNPNPYDIYEINISSEGRHLMVRHTGEFPSVDHGVYWVNLASQEIISITRDLDGNYLGNDTGFASPILFPNGETVAFEVESTDLSSIKTVFWSREKGRFGMDGFMAAVPAGYVEPSNSSQPVLSPDGKKLLFVSTTPHLVEGVADQMPHLYVRELASGKTILIDPTDLPPLSLNNFPAEIVFSPDSSRVAISIPRPGSIDQRPVLYVADLSLNTTTAVRAPGLDHLPRAAESCSSFLPNGISRDGKFVAFTSTSRDLTVDKTSEFQDIFLADLSQRSIRRISRPFGGMPETKGNAFGAQITPDGRYILYESPRTNLLELPPPAGLNIYRYDTHTGTTILVSPDDRPDAYASPTMSSDGRFVLYENDQLMILRDVQEGVSSHPYAGKIFPHSPCVISADGSTIAFNTSGRISYLKTHNNSTFQIPASTTLHPAQAALLSPEGGKAVFADGSSNILYVANLATNGVASHALAGISQIGAIAMTPDATHIVMEARLDPAISSDYQIVLFDTVVESTTVLSTNKLGQPARGSSRAPSISADGLLVTFKSDASDLVDGDGNGTQDVFLRSQRSGRIELISHNGFQRAAADRSVRAALSADGSTAILLSAASDLNGSYFNGFNQLFAATLDTITDADTDRLPDEWERLHFGDLAQPSTGDPDHDGATNYEEYMAGTDPLDPNSILRLNLMKSADGNAELIWNGVEGIHYQVQIASSLQSNLWSDLGIWLGGSQETLRVPISPPIGGSVFYRLLIVR